MTSRNDPTENRTLWFCVLDRNWRMLYLGSDLETADRSVIEGAIVRDGRNRGDAMRNAAKAIAATRRAQL